MLVQNLWIDKVLCNGAMGEATSIVYAPNNTPPSLPVAVMVKFDNYSGPKFLSTDSITIVPVMINLSLQQIPLKLSWLITIHNLKA